MPRSNGIYAPPAGSTATNGQPISSAAHNALLTDLSTALTQSIATDGTSTVTENIPMGGNKFTGLAAGSADQDSATFGQVAPGIWKTIASASTLDLGNFSERRFVVTGTTDISSLGSTGTNDGLPIQLYFQDALNIIPSTSLLTPGNVSGTGTTTNGSTSMTGVSNAGSLAIGMYAWGTGIPSGTTISGINGTTVTLSSAATASGSTSFTAAPKITTATGAQWVATCDGLGGTWRIYSPLGNFNTATLDSAGNLAPVSGQNLTKTPSSLFSVTASVSAGALTVTLNPCTLEFRSTTANSGAPVRVSVNSPISVTVPNAATLGMISGLSSRIGVAAINNAGVVELAVTNSPGWLGLVGEASLISTTAISSAATSANTIYSTNARTNVAFRAVGIFDITEATAGTWASDPTFVQGMGASGWAPITKSAWDDIVEVSLSGQANVTFYNLGVYDEIELTGWISFNTTDSVLLRFSNDNGATFITDATQIGVVTGSFSSSADNNTYATLVPFTPLAGNTAIYPVDLRFNITRLNKSGLKHVNGKASGIRSNTADWVECFVFSTGSRNTYSAANCIRVFTANGQAMSAGVMRIRGRRG